MAQVGLEIIRIILSPRGFQYFFPWILQIYIYKGYINIYIKDIQVIYSHKLCKSYIFIQIIYKLYIPLNHAQVIYSYKFNVYLFI